ncbi:MAG TPA: class I SAM-dependent methyltransferase [Pyrinomonadaceae bacterium]|nr:class I SAM-dependent methyltransferase [Pyrinomonadaceae bacterium]
MMKIFKKLNQSKPSAEEAPAKSASPDFIDVRQLIKALSVEELNKSAEEYFAQLNAWEHHLAKPFADIIETPELLVSFSHLLQGLSLSPGMTVLDFGAGSCWSSYLLTQLGCEVAALDVSKTALEIGRELYKRHPPFGNQPEPQFLHFDGHAFDLDDESVDRVVCVDAFHHVANTEQVLKEMARVLKQGGIAAFYEPGPRHSHTPQAQYEMRMNRVIENDIDVREIWQSARAAGFTDIKLSVFSPKTFLLSMHEFDQFMDGESMDSRYAAETRAFMQHHRCFFLHKGEAGLLDSRQRSGLSAEITVEMASSRTKEGEPFAARVTVKNIGTSIWLPTSSPKGPVHLGTHLLGADGLLINRDYSRHHLTPGEGRPIEPNETVSLEARVPAPPAGKYILEFDLVSEYVCWFENNGSRVVKVEVEVA